MWKLSFYGKKIYFSPSLYRMRKKSHPQPHPGHYFDRLRDLTNILRDLGSPYADQGKYPLNVCRYL